LKTIEAAGPAKQDQAVDAYLGEVNQQTQGHRGHQDFYFAAPPDAVG
jgi:hypothetical protein